MKAIFRLLTGCSLYGVSFLCLAQTASPGVDLILMRTSAKTPGEVVDAIKAHTEPKKWIYMGANSVKPKQGEVTTGQVLVENTTGAG